MDLGCEHIVQLTVPEYDLMETVGKKKLGLLFYFFVECLNLLCKSTKHLIVSFRKCTTWV